MITDKQVRLLLSLLKRGIPLVTAAVKAGMSARKYVRSGCAPSVLKVAYTWRTRPDPFADVWPEIEALLRQDGSLEAKLVWAEVDERYPGWLPPGQLCTLQRRFRAWPARSGPDRQVFFPQVHVPGEQAQSDFTDMRELQVTISGEPFAHLLYHGVLTDSNWESVSICPSESESERVAVMERLIGRGSSRIDYRHIIHQLVRRPGTFRRYVRFFG